MDKDTLIDELLKTITYDDMSNELLYLVSKYETEKWIPKVEEMKKTMDTESILEKIHHLWNFSKISDETEENLMRYVKDGNYYGDFPTLDQIKADYNKLMEIIKDVRTIEQLETIAKEKEMTVEINGMSVPDFLDGGGTQDDIEWFRYEAFGCLSYIYDNFSGKPVFDVWSNLVQYEFIENITIDKLTPERYKQEKLTSKFNN